jgi:transcriptional regulator with XRE-family HTH domain
MTEFAVLTRRYRTASLLTQEELADKSGLSARSIQNIEAGRVRRPRRTTVLLLMEALDLTTVDREIFDRAARRGRSCRFREMDGASAGAGRSAEADNPVAAAAALIQAGLDLLAAIRDEDPAHRITPHEGPPAASPVAAGGAPACDSSWCRSRGRR